MPVRIPVTDANERLWSALVELFTRLERISSLLINAGQDQTAALKDRLTELEAAAKSIATKQDRLLNLYLEGRLSKAVYDNKNHELERGAAECRSELIDVRKRIDQSSKRELEIELIHRLRILSRSHQRFTHEQKVCVFRSIVKAAHLNDSSVELDLYVNPVQTISGSTAMNRNRVRRAPASWRACRSKSRSRCKCPAQKPSKVTAYKSLIPGAVTG